MAEAGDEEPKVPKRSPELQAFKDKVDAMDDDDALQSLLDSTADSERRKILRARLRIVRVKKRDNGGALLESKDFDPFDDDFDDFGLMPSSSGFGELREARLNAGEEAMMKSKMAMAEASKDSQLESYSMKYSASSSSYKSSVTEVSESTS